ncbi:MAG TPA: bifunctional acetate--CoA ligase family protein/GNAT family N-acetyltransferase [Usitatibacter sp.]|nr:bifunctional acetate--CoA ligase family protein/GNAT family N-acetyltransferase [Usitatibacter sp.]
MGRHYLSRLFEPASVALVGASAQPQKVGGVLLGNLLAANFRGRLYAVNPRHRELRGVPCVATIEALPEAVDLAVIATPAPTVAGLVAACGAKGIGAVVVITAGFGESGAAGKAMEADVLAAARRHGVRMLGPNCLGLMRPSLGLNATFARGTALPGSLALLSQSGAVCTALVDWATPSGIGFSSVISLGASGDIDFGEALDFLAFDPATAHILLYVEGVRDARRLMGSLRAAARMKPVVVMKVGRHPAGSRAAVSHTGAIVGRDDVFDAAVRRAGIVRVATAGQLVAAAQALGSAVAPGGDRLAIVTNGGGPGVMAADRATELGIPLAELSPATIDRLQRALPAHWSHGNPIDLIGDADAERYRAALAACLDDPGVDGVIAILTPQAMTPADDAASAVIGAAAGAPKPVLACWMGEASVGAARARLQQAGVPAFRLPEMAVEAFAYVAQHQRHQRLLLEVPPPLVATEPPDLEAARALIHRALAEGRSVLAATESKELLAAFRIPVVRSRNAASAEEAVTAAEAVGFPVAMKIRSPDITHKSDVHGIELGLSNAPAVREAFARMLSRVATLRPQARVEGVSIEAMVARPHGRELMAGITRDPVFGPAITFGAGGIAVEVLRDRVVGLPPLNARLVEDMIAGTRVAKMLERFRHLPPVDRPAIDAILLRISEIATELPEVVEMDVNPIIADEQGAIALDARFVVAAVPEGRDRHAHLAIAPYPSELVTREILADGEELTLRPIRPEDAAMEARFVEALSVETRRRRFQGTVAGLTPTMIARFTQIDYDREMALVAIDAAAAQVAVARYVSLPDAISCEFAIVVADAWQGRGLGHRMMQRLIAIAAARGLRAMVGWVLASNEPMLRLMARLGFEIGPEPGDSLNRRVALDLQAGERLTGRRAPAPSSA